jgi:hypothetical protein
MNQRILKRAGWGVAAIMALTLNATDLQAQATNGKATVRAIRGGDAQYSVIKAGEWSEWSKLRVGYNLYQGSKIKTAGNTTVDLFLGRNGPVVRVTAASGLGLDTLSFDDSGAQTIIDTQLDLTDGRILGRVKSLIDASRYEVKTPSAIVGIRGTEYDISVDSTTTIIEGSAVVAFSSGGTVTTHVVQQAQTFNPGSRSVVGALPAVTAPIEAAFQEIRPLADETAEQVVEAVVQETGAPPETAPGTDPTVVPIDDGGALDPRIPVDPAGGDEEIATDPVTEPRVDPETGEDAPTTPDGPVETSIPAAD